MPEGRNFIQSKQISVEQSLAKIKTNDSIISALAAAEPSALLWELHTIGRQVATVTFSTRAAMVCSSPSSALGSAAASADMMLSLVLIFASACSTLIALL